MRKRYVSMFIGLMMAVVIAFPAMATEASADVPAEDVTEDTEDFSVENTAVVLAEITSDDLMEAAEEISADISFENVEEDAEDVSDEDTMTGETAPLSGIDSADFIEADTAEIHEGGGE